MYDYINLPKSCNLIAETYYALFPVMQTLFCRKLIVWRYTMLHASMRC